MWCVLATLLQPALALSVDQRSENGTVIVSAELPHSVEAVRALLADESVTMRLGSNIREVAVTPLSNGCAQLDVTQRGLHRELKYVSERCPTPNGWRATMVSSDDFVRHDIHWSVHPVNERTKVVIVVDVQLRTIIPRWMIDRFVGNALEGTLRTMHAMLDQRHIESQAMVP